MRLSPTTRAVYLRLARDLPASGPGRMPLLREGTVLTSRFVEVLVTQGSSPPRPRTSASR